MMSDAPRASVAAPRPLRADARRNFEAVLAAAKDSFAENGPDASLEEIARQAGVGIATLYRNFPTRSSLIEAVYFDEVEALCRTAEDLADLPPWDALVGWLRRFVAYLATKRALIEGLNRDSDMFRSAKDAMYGTSEPLLVRAQKSGDVRDDVGIAEMMLLVHGLMSVNYASDDQRERVLGLALDGLRPPRVTAGSEVR
ncbi:MAG: TetR family transcriptional regulator [Microbacteriaceae bacterium]|jgi:AcrR family transcriptional regulator|nr:TetR family transcriptional regulator [Microbacteriaceae bacterium]